MTDAGDATDHRETGIADRLGKRVAEFDFEAFGYIEARGVDPRSVLPRLFDGLRPDSGSGVQERQRIADAMDQLTYRFEWLRRRVETRHGEACCQQESGAKGAVTSPHRPRAW
jgi:hypothetical protein